jgi:hypothetical protein
LLRKIPSANSQSSPLSLVNQNRRINYLSYTQARVINADSTFQITKLARHLDDCDSRTLWATTQDRIGNVVFRAGGYAARHVWRVEAVEVYQVRVAVGGAGGVVGVTEEEEGVWYGTDGGVGAGGVVGY